MLDISKIQSMIAESSNIFITREQLNNNLKYAISAVGTCTPETIVEEKEWLYELFVTVATNPNFNKQDAKNILFQLTPETLENILKFINRNI